MARWQDMRGADDARRDFDDARTDAPASRRAPRTERGARRDATARDGASRNASVRRARTSRSAGRRGAGAEPMVMAAEGNSRRSAWVFAVFAVVTALILAKLVYLQVVKADEYSAMALSERKTQTVVIEARRGTIYDRNGNVLAISVDAAKVIANPDLIDDPQATAEAIAQVLDGDAEDYVDKLTSSTYDVVAAGVSVAEGEAVEALGLVGVDVEDAANVLVNPSEVSDLEAVLEAVAGVTGDDAQDYLDAIDEDSSQDEEVALGVTVAVGEAVAALGLAGVTVEDAATVSANPDEVEDADAATDAIFEVLGGDDEDYSAYYAALFSATRVTVAEEIDVDLGEQIEALGLTGVTVEDDTRREYPYGDVGATVIGVCGTVADEESGSEVETGTSGLEAYYDDVLSGEPGYYTVELAADLTTVIPGTKVVGREATDGQDIVVSIDVELQASLEEALTEGLEELDCDDGEAIIMDGSTGEILAAASLPLLEREDVEVEATVLKAVTRLVEPGSVFKSVSALALLENGAMTPDSTKYCPVSITVDDYVITDSHTRSPGTMTLREIITTSSNVGISLSVADELGWEAFYETIYQCGFQELTGVDYPGEFVGTLTDTDSDSWSNINSYNNTFGQGLTVSPIQIVRFYAALANDGVAVTPHFLISKTQSDEAVEWDSELMIEDETAVEDLTSMLESVVEEGTGTEAAIEGYTVAGKTSTAEISDTVNGGYLDGVYYLAFCGYLVDASSSLVCYVGANEVEGMQKVTPIFNDIMTAAIERYAVTP